MFKLPARETRLITDASIIFPNFAGKEDKYNREGDRNFCILLNEELAQELLIDGWNVKKLKSREVDEPDQPYLQVSVSYRRIPPKIAMITSRGKTILEEDMLDILDYVEIERADVNMSPYEWSVNGSSGRKAYLKTLYIVVREDPLDLMYANVPEVGGSFPRELESSNPRQYDYEGEEVVTPPQRELGR